MLTVQQTSPKLVCNIYSPINTLKPLPLVLRAIIVQMFVEHLHRKVAEKDLDGEINYGTASLQLPDELEDLCKTCRVSYLVVLHRN
jgi:hypothetical protein